jgi:hypothetical protein
MRATLKEIKRLAFGLLENAVNHDEMEILSASSKAAS